MIRARQLRRQYLRVQQFQDAVPGCGKFSPNRASIEEETYEFTRPDPSVVLDHGAYADGSSFLVRARRRALFGVYVATLDLNP
jgi:hypothetical protein